jgi:putative hydrolase
VTTDLSLNQLVADRLREAASLLEQQSANPFRVSAYRQAADSVVNCQRNLGEILQQEGFAGLMSLPMVGYGIAGAIREILTTGHWSQLQRLRGTLDPIQLFQSVPGIGPQLAQRIHDRLNIDTLEALETAAHNGSLESVPGVGARRAEILRATLAQRLGRVRDQKAKMDNGPSIELLLDVDREYLEKGRAGQLPTIAPRRFNPSGESWLPILHTSRGEWHFTALYSNSALAHELARTQDWVVIYFYDEHHHEGQHTIVTETHGPLVGNRVVRGRESECQAYYSNVRTTEDQLKRDVPDTLFEL